MEIKRIKVDFCEVLIETDKGRISCNLHGSQKCCETYGVQLCLEKDVFETTWDSGSVSYDTGGECDCEKHICDCEFCGVGVVHNCNEGVLRGLIGKKIENIRFDRPDLVLRFEDKEVRVCPYVNHNGYYPHEYTIKYPDNEIELEVGRDPPDICKVIEKLGSL